MGKRLLGILSCCLLSTAAYGVEEDLISIFGDEEMVSLATGKRQPIAVAPAVATVITAQDIENMGATNLDEILESVPGLHVSVSSARYTSTYQIRGISTDFNPQVLLLVNGIPMTHSTQGNRGYHPNMRANMIERIEVIRGPGSAVYGADAFSGVINVITKSANNQNHNQFGFRAGSFSTNEVWLDNAWSWKNLDMWLGIEAYTTDGDDDRIIKVDAQTIFDPLAQLITGQTASLAPGPVNTQEERLDLRFEMAQEKWKLRLWNWQQKDVGIGQGAASALDPNGSDDINNSLLDFSYKSELSNDWTIGASASYLHLDIETNFILFPPGTVLPVGPDGNLSPTGFPVIFPDGLRGNPSATERHTRGDFYALYHGVDKHTVRIAAGLHRAEVETSETKNFGPGVIDGTQPVVDGTLTDVTGTPFIFMESNDRRDYFVSLQDEWSYAPDWTLTSGIRFDKYSDFGSTANPRLALVWATKHNLTTKLLYGRAFRAPAFLELFAINNPIVLGNENLDPEIIDTYELAFDYKLNFSWRLKLNLFSYEIEDLIQYVPEPDGSRARNFGEQEGEGFEFEVTWNPGDSDKILISSHYAFQDSKDPETGQEIPNVPEALFYFNVNWKIGDGYALNAKLKSVMDRNRAAIIDPRDNISNYKTLDLYLQKTLGDWKLSAGVRNALDEEVFEPSPANPLSPLGSLVPGDFPLSGRSFNMGLKYNY